MANRIFGGGLAQRPADSSGVAGSAWGSCYTTEANGTFVYTSYTNYNPLYRARQLYKNISVISVSGERR